MISRTLNMQRYEHPFKKFSLSSSFNHTQGERVNLFVRNMSAPIGVPERSRLSSCVSTTNVKTIFEVEACKK